ncbi:MAG: peptidase T [Lachnospiraceae bacterium]|nr:peptidase T [Lachnospiraceae bacterium]
MKPYERLIKYVQVYTTSDEHSETTPTAAREFDLAHMLVEEMKKIGITDAHVDDKCYVYGSIPATPGMEDKPAIGFVAHMDTAPDFSGEHVQPVIHKNYDGEDVVLGDSGRVLSVADFPHLKEFKGRTLITTDGTTLLGADDKAGVAEIMTAMERILTENIPHGKICIGFTPDEEVGAGADYFDVEHFGAKYAYTVDGDLEGGIEYDNFNASAAEVTVHGNNVHPGRAKDIMVNSLTVGMEFHGLLPKDAVPEKTEGYEGFIHLTNVQGDVAETTMEYIIRDHDMEKFHAKEDLMRNAVATINEKYGEGTIEIQIKESYLNMKSKIEDCMEIIDWAKEATRMAGIAPREVPIRGGTDGARLSFMGLPCPNLGTGGFGFHGPYEHITAEGMEICTQIICNIVKTV